ATSVATFDRSPIAFPFPRGCTALVSKMMYVCVVGSIHIDVPVHPVCPNDPTGNRSPRFDENGESISHPNPRSTGAAGGCSGEVIFSTVTADKIPPPPFSSACAKFARSSAVENSPACPATPPIRRALGSCTTPRSMCSCSSNCVGAILDRHEEGGRYRVRVIFKGAKTCAVE